MRLREQIVDPAIIAIVASQRKIDPSSLPPSAYAMFSRRKRTGCLFAYLVVPFPALVRTQSGKVDCDSRQSGPKETMRIYMTPFDEEDARLMGLVEPARVT